VTRALTPSDREIYAALADELIPPHEGLPSASAARVATDGIDRVLSARPDLLTAVLTMIDAAEGGDPAATLATVRERKPPVWQQFGLATAGAYLSSEDVRRRIGYPGQETASFRADQEPEYLDMLSRVVERGPIFRDVTPTV
jgi:hypothetical protein